MQRTAVWFADGGAGCFLANRIGNFAQQEDEKNTVSAQNPARRGERFVTRIRNINGFAILEKIGIFYAHLQMKFPQMAIEKANPMW